MQRSTDAKGKAQSENAQLLRLHERVLGELKRIAGELQAPETRALLHAVRKRTGDSQENMTDVLSALGDAIRTLKVSESKLRLNLKADTAYLRVEGIPNLPATLARFIAERKESAGFSYEVRQDEVRGWVIRWKEFTPAGTVRGSGQFYERPYAWLED